MRKIFSLSWVPDWIRVSSHFTGAAPSHPIEGLHQLNSLIRQRGLCIRIPGDLQDCLCDFIGLVGSFNGAHARRERLAKLLESLFSSFASTFTPPARLGAGSK